MTLKQSALAHTVVTLALRAGLISTREMNFSRDAKEHARWFAQIRAELDDPLRVHTPAADLALRDAIDRFTESASKAAHSPAPKRTGCGVCGNPPLSAYPGSVQARL